MQQQTRLSRWCEHVMEAGWLIALALIPIYFNLFSARHFEPDKATALRSIVLIMAAAGVVRLLEAFNQRSAASEARPATSDTPPTPSDAPAQSSLWKRFSRIPLAVPAVVYALVFVLTTITSVVPLTSFWGSYQRLQGTYTNLSYIGLFALIVVTLRHRAQLERIVTVSLMAALVVAGYGVLQHFQLDPLPWRGDVITRVASTMGNSIFVAAYMIMIVPLALYRLFTALHVAEEGQAERDADGLAANTPGLDWLWTLAYGLVVVGSLTLLLSMVKFGAAVRTADFRYWWVLPGAIMLATALWWLFTAQADRTEQRVPLWPGIVYGSYLLFFGLLFAVSQLQRAQQVDQQATLASDWPLWLVLSIVSIAGFYGLALRLPKRSAVPSRLAQRISAGAFSLITVVLLVAIFFTQSRGPWIGAGAGLFVFFSLLLWQSMRRARHRENVALAHRLRLLLSGWVAITLLVGTFLIAFNVSNAPMFERLRSVPYVGRMGELLEVNSGTGLVRRLIWAGDSHAGGAVALITSNPLRAVIGWGPESMFVAYNPFYPPSLANIEARGASPDRSHQAILDELVTKGLLGLVSYVFVVASFYVLCWRLMQRSTDWRWQVFFIACLSAVTSSLVEGLTGIPIVSTLMMFWVLLAVAVTGGALAGHYRLSLAPPAPILEAEPVVQTTTKTRGKRSVRGVAARGASAARSRGTGARSGRRTQTNSAALGVYGLLIALTLGAVWWFNLNPVYADMRFQEGQSLSTQTASGLGAQLQAMDDFLATIRSNPREDFYYLNLGRTLMTLADGLRSQGIPLGQPKPDASVDDLLRLESVDAVQGFVQSSTPLSLLSYAEAVLRQAYQLNPLNKDHYANLGRLDSVWYSWTNDPARLNDALNWFDRVSVLAPQDVVLINERAGTLLQLGNYAQSMGDTEQANANYDQAADLLNYSKSLDVRYTDTDVRMADLQRAQGDLDAAVASYVQLIATQPQQVDASVESIAGALRDRPDLLEQLRAAYVAAAERSVTETTGLNGAALQAKQDRAALSYAIAGLLAVRANDNEQALAAYQQAAGLKPDSIEYRRNYTVILSDTQRYDDALNEAQQVLTLLQAQPGRENEAAQMQALIAYLQQQ